MDAFNVEQEADNLEHVVIGRERREPSYGQVANPDDEDERVDRQKASHDERDGVRVFKTLACSPPHAGRRRRVFGDDQEPDRVEELDQEQDEERELVRRKEQDEQEQCSQAQNALDRK